MKKILSIIIFCLTLVSCKKKVLEGTYTIKGHIYNDCSKTPLKNYLLLLRDNYYENNRPKYVTYDTTYTDNNGYFEFTFTNPTSGLLYITGSNGIYPGFINALPITNLDNLEVIYEVKASVIPKLSLKKNYSNNDTLYVVGYNSTSYKVVGPFNNGQILPTFKYTLSNLEYNRNYQARDVKYWIGYDGAAIDTIINVYPCTNDTVIINLN